MLCIALTGGIGSGKSTVAHLFKKLGVTIIDADNIAHRITEPNTYSFESIVEHFGKDILESRGMIDRKRLREIIFRDTKERQWLEQLLHPVIREAMRERMLQAKTAYCLLVIPLLKETTPIDYIDRICVIDTSQSLQIQRVMQRDHISQADAEAIIKAQSSNKERLKIADDIIHNHGDLSELKEQVQTLNRKYLSFC